MATPKALHSIVTIALSLRDDSQAEFTRHMPGGNLVPHKLSSDNQLICLIQKIKTKHDKKYSSD